MNIKMLQEQRKDLNNQTHKIDQHRPQRDFHGTLLTDKP
jgi:hypothetical protein